MLCQISCANFDKGQRTKAYGDKHDDETDDTLILYFACYIDVSVVVLLGLIICSIRLCITYAPSGVA